MKRKLIIAITSLSIVLSVVACGNKDNSIEPIGATTTNSVTETEEKKIVATENIEPIEAQDTETVSKYEPAENSNDTESEVSENAPAIEESEAPVADYTVEEISATMYATQTVNVRDLPTTEGNKVGSKSYAEKVEVTGKVTSYKGEKCLWYQLSDGTFVSGNYLSNTKPAQQTSNSNSNSNTGSTQSSSDTEGQTVTSSGSGTGDGSSRANRSGSDMEYTGGEWNLH